MKQTSGANSAGALSHPRLHLNKRRDLPIKKAFTLIVLKQDLNTSYFFSPPNAQSAHKCESGCVKLPENEKLQRRWREVVSFLSFFFFVFLFPLHFVSALKQRATVKI